ncbi:MAG TPA: hypothetical protein VM101_15510 [Flavitalea sp.]|nr:hypothetical protein [Flavitalea sp.]
MQTLNIPLGRSTFTGILWTRNGKKVWTTDTRGFLRSAILKADGIFSWSDEILLPSRKFTNGKFAWQDKVLYKKMQNDDRAYCGGFAIDEKRSLIYVTLNRDNAIGVVSMKTMKFISHINVGIAPYTIVINGNKAYVTNWGGRFPVKGDKTALSSGTPVIVDSMSGVASSGSVSVIDLQTRKVKKQIKVHLHPQLWYFILIVQNYMLLMQTVI